MISAQMLDPVLRGFDGDSEGWMDGWDGLGWNWVGMGWDGMGRDGMEFGRNKEGVRYFRSMSQRSLLRVFSCYAPRSRAVVDEGFFLAKPWGWHYLFGDVADGRGNFFFLFFFLVEEEGRRGGEGGGGMLVVRVEATVLGFSHLGGGGCCL